MNKFMSYGICDNHEEVFTCECGANRICHSCGFGSFSMPCECRPIKGVQIMEVKKPRQESIDKMYDNLERICTSREITFVQKARSFRL